MKKKGTLKDFIYWVRSIKKSLFHSLRSRLLTFNKSTKSYETIYGKKVNVPLKALLVVPSTPKYIVTNKISLDKIMDIENFSPLYMMQPLFLSVLDGFVVPDSLNSPRIPLNEF